MAWERLNHECYLPSREKLREQGIRKGSVWRCEEPGCNRRWRVKEFPPGDVDWEMIR